MAKGQSYFCSSIVNPETTAAYLLLFSATNIQKDRYDLLSTLSFPNRKRCLSVCAGSSSRNLTWRTHTLAKQMRKKFQNPYMFLQAVGGAVEDPLISMIISSHRVVKNGHFTSYAEEIDRKQIDAISSLLIPKTGTALY